MSSLLLWDSIYAEDGVNSDTAYFFLAGLFEHAKEDESGNIVFRPVYYKKKLPKCYKEVIVELDKIGFIQKDRTRVELGYFNADLSDNVYYFEENRKKSDNNSVDYADVIRELANPVFEEYVEYCKASRKYAYFTRVYSSFNKVILKLGKSPITPTDFLLVTRCISAAYKQVLAVDFGKGTAKDYTQIKRIMNSGDPDLIIASYVYFVINGDRFKTNSVNLYTFRHHFIDIQASLNKYINRIKSDDNGKTIGF